MIRLVHAELLRLLARRMTLVTAAVLLVAVGLFQLAVNSAVTPPSAADLAQNRRYLEQAKQDWQKHHKEYEQQCRDSGAPAEQCTLPEPTSADFAMAATPFAEIGTQGMLLVAFVSLLASYLVAASFIGAEYSTGSLANWLSFVPERLKVYAAKLVAVVVAAALSTAVLAGLMFGLMALLTSFHGGALTGAGGVAAAGGRTVAMAVVAAIFGFGLALATRHTVAALGLVLAYLVLSQVVQGLSFSVPLLQHLPPWLPEYNLVAFVQHGASYNLTTPVTTASGTDYQSIERHISFAHSAVYWAALVVVAVVIPAAIFRRRDLT